MHAQHQPLKGVFTALVTPFNADGSIDSGALSALVNRQMTFGVHGLVPFGSSGEGPTITTLERASIIKLCLETTKRQVPIIAGIICNDTAQSINLHLASKDAGATHVMHAIPSYNKPTQEGLLTHFIAISKGCDLPFLIYNNPPRSGLDLSVDTLEKIVHECPNFVGIKDSNTDPLRMQILINNCLRIRPNLSVLAGEDAFLLPLLAMGGQGIISTTANLDGASFIKLYNSFLNGDFVGSRTLANKLAPLINLMFCSSNPIPLKMALSKLNLIKPNFRLPLCPLTEKEATELFEKLGNLSWQSM